MNRLELLNARTLSRTAELVVGRIEPLLFLFKLYENGRVIRVTLNHKGWLCDAAEVMEHYERRCYLASKKGKPKPIRWNHALNKGKECEHIIACKMFLRKINVLDRLGVFSMDCLHGANS